METLKRKLLQSSNKKTGAKAPAFLCCSIYHIFDEDAISGGGVVDEDMGNSADQFSCCGARCAPCRRCGRVAHRPQPLAQLPFSAPGGGRIAPRPV